jgi:hypothetical protein
MATTRYKKNVSPDLINVARFTVTADNDVLLPAGDYLVLGAYHHSANTTALNLAAGADIAAYPAKAANQTVCATAAGTGDITLLWVEIPAPGYTTFSV